MGLKTLLSLQKTVENEITLYVKELKKSPLAYSMHYSLSSKGKRLRPLLVLLMSKAIGRGFDVSKSALAIELFHTASLIADDLPCMDDDDERRGKPSLHKAYSESTALLTSYAFLTEGFSQISKSGEVYYKKGYGSSSESDKRVRIALEETTKLSGPVGATLGQYLDIEGVKAVSEEYFENLYYLKTGTLFQGAFTLGYIFGGGDLSKLHLIERLSKHLGFAFQIRDDLEDMEKEEISYPRYYGKKASIKRCENEIEGFFSALETLEINSKPFIEIINFLFQKEIYQTFQHVPL